MLICISLWLLKIIFSIFSVFLFWGFVKINGSIGWLSFRVIIGRWGCSIGNLNFEPMVIIEMQETHFWIKVFIYFGINFLNHKMYTCFLKKRKVCDRIMILETRTLHLWRRTCLVML